MSSTFREDIKYTGTVVVALATIWFATTWVMAWMLARVYYFGTCFPREWQYTNLPFRELYEVGSHIYTIIHPPTFFHFYLDRFGWTMAITVGAFIVFCIFMLAPHADDQEDGPKGHR